MVRSPSRTPLRGTIVTGKLDHFDFRSLAKSNAAFSFSLASRLARNPSAAATAWVVAVDGFSVSATVVAGASGQRAA